MGDIFNGVEGIRRDTFFSGTELKKVGGEGVFSGTWFRGREGDLLRDRRVHGGALTKVSMENSTRGCRFFSFPRVPFLHAVYFEGRGSFSGV